MVNLPFGLQIGKQQPQGIQIQPSVAPPPPTVEDIQRVMAMAHEKATGSVGTELYSGYPTEEYLSELRGEERARKFDEMRRSDGQCRMLLSSIMNPICSANWEIQAADDSPEATLDKMFVEQCLMGSEAPRPFSSTLREIGSTMVIHGAAAVEKTYKFVAKDINYGAHHAVKALDLISPKTIDRWNVDKETQRLASITQISNGDLGKGMTEIPAPYLMVFNIDQEGANYEGIGMFRPIYGNYFRKAVFLRLNAIGTEKYAVPCPIITMPIGFQDTPGYNALIAALEVYASGQSNYLIVPEGVKVEWPTASNYDPGKVDATIDAEDRRMAKAFLANFLELGMNGAGSHAQSGDLSDFFLDGIQYIGTRMCDPFNLQLIPELVRMNRGPRAKYPKLIVTGISDQAGLELAQILDILVKNKIVVPDDKMEESMRKRFGLSIKSLIGQRDVTPPAPFGGGFGGAPGGAGEPGKVVPPQPKPGQPPAGAPQPPQQKKFTFSELIRRRLCD